MRFLEIMGRQTCAKHGTTVAMEERPTISLIGANPETRSRLERVLAEHFADVFLVNHAHVLDTVEYAALHSLEGIVMDGAEDAIGGCAALKASELTKAIPLILLFEDSDAVHDDAIAIGVEDFATVTLHDVDLAARIRWMRLLGRARAEERWALARIKEQESAYRCEIRTIEGRYRRLVESWPDMMVVCTDGMATYVNDAGRQLLGPETSAYVLGRPAEELAQEAYRDTLRKMVGSCDQTGSTMPYALMKLKGDDGQSIHVEAAALGFERMDGKHVLLVLRDVREREHLSVKFQKAQRLEAVGQLAGGVAHDFNNILTTIRGYSDLVLQSLPKGDPLTSDIQEIKNSTERAASLTRQLLAFSRRQLLEPAPLDLNKVVLDIKRMLMRVIGEHIELKTDLEPELGTILADRSQIEQVIMNLAVNARDAIPGPGAVTLLTRNVSVDEARKVEGLDLTPAPHVLFQMTDTGVGMSEETALRIFEPFFTTKGQDKGTGLGLSTVYGIVKQSGGDIAVSSRLGEGSTFRIYLPIQPELNAAMATVRTELGPVRGWETILLVEDEITVRMLAKRLLERAGYTVVSAQNGQEAIEICDSLDGPIHLIVADVVMPQMGGIELARRLRDRYSDIKVLLMSGYSDRDAFGPGEMPVGFLQKPFSYEELTREVRKLLDLPTPAALE